MKKLSEVPFNKIYVGMPVILKLKINCKSGEITDKNILEGFDTKFIRVKLYDPGPYKNNIFVTESYFDLFILDPTRM